MHSLALPSFKAKFSKRTHNYLSKLQYNRTYKEVLDKVKAKQCIALLIQGDIKKQAQSFPVIKKTSLPKCTGKLAGWLVFLLTLGKRTASRAQKKKA